MLIHFQDPQGNRLEVFHGAHRSAEPLCRGARFRASGRGRSAPSGLFVEYGWGVRVIELQNWEPHETFDGPGLW